MSGERILVTGGAGFIGSHACKALAAEGMIPIAFDNLGTGRREAVRWGELVAGDIRDTEALITTIRRHEPACVIHFAAAAYVSESVEDPAKYYLNNVAGTLSLLEACRAAGTMKVIFSSSCATYGVPVAQPIDEETPQLPVNPYGRTKLMGEQILGDYARAYGMRFVILRYFNASGADPDGEIGEWHDPETHLIPRALLAAGGFVPHLDIFGVDYDTSDGTCVRDYVHVSDLARAHVLAAHHLFAGGADLALNLGSGAGTSVREVVACVERCTGRKVPVCARDRRPGDPAVLCADGRRARSLLGFEPLLSDLETIVRTAAPFFLSGAQK
jgi:UDP-arabinose 4-epimerase